MNTLCRSGEMADASALGADDGNIMEVQVLSPAPRIDSSKPLENTRHKRSAPRPTRLLHIF